MLLEFRKACVGDEFRTNFTGGKLAGRKTPTVLSKTTSSFPFIKALKLSCTTLDD